MKILTDPRSGSYQGLTSSRNRYGQYVRTRATPVNPATAFQQDVRVRLASSASGWRNLTDSQREAWTTLGQYMSRRDSLGQLYNLTGLQAFISVNNNLLAAGDAAVTLTPPYDPPAGLESVTPTASTSAISVAWTPTPLDADVRVFVWASRPRSMGVSFEGDMRLIQVSAAAAASPLAISTAYIARFGAPVAGQAIFVGAQTYRAGFLSPMVMAKVEVS